MYSTVVNLLIVGDNLLDMKTIKKVPYEPIFVDHIPEEMEDGKVYISEKYHVAVHRCLCGCGEQTVMPFYTNPNIPPTWSMIKENNGTVSFTPSVGNYQLPCSSHYIMTKNVANFV